LSAYTGESQRSDAILAIESGILVVDSELSTYQLIWLLFECTLSSKESLFPALSLELIVNKSYIAESRLLP